MNTTNPIVANALSVVQNSDMPSELKRIATSGVQNIIQEIGDLQGRILGEADRLKKQAKRSGDSKEGEILYTYERNVTAGLDRVVGLLRSLAR